MTALPPDNLACKTRHLGGLLWECYVRHAAVCPFSIYLGTEIFCLHQDCEKFALPEERPDLEES
jgi:hypothetical protein